MSEGKATVAVQAPRGPSFDLGDNTYSLEREALDPIGAEIVQIDAKSKEEFVAEAKSAQAVIAQVPSNQCRDHRRSRGHLGDWLWLGGHRHGRCRRCHRGRDPCDQRARCLHRRGRRSRDDADPGYRSQDQPARSHGARGRVGERAPCLRRRATAVGADSRPGFVRQRRSGRRSPRQAVRFSRHRVRSLCF